MVSALFPTFMTGALHHHGLLKVTLQIPTSPHPNLPNLFWHSKFLWRRYTALTTLLLGLKPFKVSFHVQMTPGSLAWHERSPACLLGSCCSSLTLSGQAKGTTRSSQIYALFCNVMPCLCRVSFLDFHALLSTCLVYTRSSSLCSALLSCASGPWLCPMRPPVQNC